MMAIEHTAAMPNTAQSRPIRPSGAQIPLSMMRPGETARILSVRGKDETRRFLQSLGFVEEAEVTVVSELGGNVIVQIKDARVAVSKEMASRILAG